MAVQRESQGKHTLKSLMVRLISVIVYSCNLNIMKCIS